MSLVADPSFFAQEHLRSIMKKDTVNLLIMSSGEELSKKIKLAEKVLGYSKSATSILTGKLGEEEYRSIEIYIDMIKLILKNK